MCLCSAYEIPTLCLDGTRTYAPLRPPAMPEDGLRVTARDVTVIAADNNDGYEIPIPTHVAPSPPRVNTY